MKYKNISTGKIVDAFQYDGDLFNKDGDYYVPDWAVAAYNKGEFYYKNLPYHPAAMFVNVEVEQESVGVYVGVGDYIVKRDDVICPTNKEYFEVAYCKVDENNTLVSDILEGQLKLLAERSLNCCDESLSGITESMISVTIALEYFVKRG